MSNSLETNAGPRLYAGATPADAKWISADKAKQLKSINSPDYVTNKSHYNRRRQIENLNNQFGVQRANPALARHKTMTPKEKKWMSKHMNRQRERLAEKEEAKEAAEDVPVMAGEREDSPPPFISSREPYVIDSEYIASEAKSQDRNDVRDMDCSAGFWALRKQRTIMPAKTLEDVFQNAVAAYSAGPLAVGTETRSVSCR